MGKRMSGIDSWAIVLPSVNSAIECTTLWGCTTTFRCLALAYDAGRAGGTAPAWLSAANEVAVDAFLEGRIRWTQIAEANDAALQQWQAGPCVTVDDVVAADATAREVTRKVLSRWA